MSEPDAALALLRYIANLEGVDLDTTRPPQVDPGVDRKMRDYILALYADCINATRPPSLFG